MKRRIGTRLLVLCGSSALLLYAAAAMFGQGGRGFFSPDTLECRTQSELLLPIVNVPLYRGRDSTHHWPVVDYLVAEGYWSKADTPEPRWLPVFRWNQQWNDGESPFYRELSWHGDRWVEWSKENPEMAKALWPKVLSALRRPDVYNVAAAADLMTAARLSQGVGEFERLADEVSAARVKR